MRAATLQPAAQLCSGVGLGCERDLVTPGCTHSRRCPTSPHTVHAPTLLPCLPEQHHAHTPSAAPQAAISSTRMLRVPPHHTLCPQRKFFPLLPCARTCSSPHLRLGTSMATSLSRPPGFQEQQHLMRHTLTMHCFTHATCAVSPCLAWAAACPHPAEAPPAATQWEPRPSTTRSSPQTERQASEPL